MFEGFALLATPPRDLPLFAAVFVLATGFLFGSLWGSFLNVVIARVPKGISVVSPRSRCPKCETMITARDNVPIVSWLLLGRKCRTCKTPISARYPFIELLGGIAGAACVARFGFTLPALELFTFICLLIAMSFIDLDTYSVPLSMWLGLIVTGLGFGVARWFLLDDTTLGHIDASDVLDRVIGGVGAGLMLASVIVLSTATIRLLQIARMRGNQRRRRTPLAQRPKTRLKPRGAGAMRLPQSEWAMGWGDPLIIAGLGAYLGWQLMPLTLFLSSLIGSVIGIGAKLGGKLKDRKPISDDDPWVPPDTALPFGPFLALGGLLAAFFGDALLAQLLPLLGFGPEEGVLYGSLVGDLSQQIQAISTTWLG